MNDQNLFDNLRRRFTANGVSPAYTDHLINEELQLHLQVSVRYTPAPRTLDQPGRIRRTRRPRHRTTNPPNNPQHTRDESFIGRHRILSMILIRYCYCQQLDLSSTLTTA